MGISAVLIVKNEEKNIEACLRSVSFVDEIIVVDSGSRDRTIELARAVGARVAVRDFDNFSGQKNFAVSLATQEWILSIDADERVSNDLQKEILGIVSQRREINGYEIRRQTNLFGRNFVASDLQNDTPIRLFRQGNAIFRNPVHEIVEVVGKTGRLSAKLDHVSFQTIQAHLSKLQLYTTLEAQSMPKNPKMRFFWDFFARPFYRFLSIYMLKQGFRDGIEGFFYAVLSGYYEWVRWMKKWEWTQKISKEN